MATLILEDGSRFEGTLFGHKAAAAGEVIFTTGMIGYQEVVTDPSYAGQIVCMTYPLIGNVGINDVDFQSAGAHMKGLVVSELCDLPSNWQTKDSLESYLDDRVFAGVSGSTLAPDAADVAGFAAYVEAYKKLLAVEQTAIDTL